MKEAVGVAEQRHTYDVSVVWTGNRGPGTTAYDAYDRDHDVTAPGRPPIAGSSDPSFRGDPQRWNPEQLLVASLSQCHMLWYLHLAARAGVVVTAYEDDAHGVMVTDESGGGRFERVVLSPRVTITADSDPEVAEAVHARVPDLCYISRSVDFPVEHDPETIRDV